MRARSSKGLDKNRHDTDENRALGCREPTCFQRAESNSRTVVNVLVALQLEHRLLSGESRAPALLSALLATIYASRSSAQSCSGGNKARRQSGATATYQVEVVYMRRAVMAP